MDAHNTIIMLTVFTLLFMFEIKHFVCDFVGQNEYMLGKFKVTGWVLPLSAHCVVNALGTAIVVLVALKGTSWVLPIIAAMIEFVTHFFIDRWKASPNYGGKYKPTEKKFWINLGIDQMGHRLVNYVIILIIVISM